MHFCRMWPDFASSNQNYESSVSFVGTFLRSRSRHLPRSRDRLRTRQRVDVERVAKRGWGGRRSARRRGTRRGCPNGIRIGMGREACTKQPRRHPAKIATLASWLAHGKHTVPRERKQILRNRAAYCLGILRHGVDFGINVDIFTTPYLPARTSRTIGSRSILPRNESIVFRTNGIVIARVSLTLLPRRFCIPVYFVINSPAWNSLNAVSLKQSCNCIGLHTTCTLKKFTIVIFYYFFYFS